uniref:AlNc14C19G1994 protein n=1 Tax=Albugo laibachii Nc14 TaxID=890382 RepID=F0W523_9STRA|nr:AlNc14C19G1994 [Albugo laibachii Nc14]|eukprot:CCA16214.1 AlNc14C19G1994 [Albugo laibachii Nc14]
MECPSQSHQNALKQLSCFVSFSDDDEVAQSVLEELSYARRSYADVIASMGALSPSGSSEKYLTPISEDS